MPAVPLVRDRLLALLARQPAARAADLAQGLGVSVPTLHRLLQADAGSGEAPRVVSAGKARRARYALRRPLRGDWAELPLYRINPQGQALLIGRLALVHPQGSCLLLATDGLATDPLATDPLAKEGLADTRARPLPDESRDGWWPGLPYPLYDMRPQGYLGRQLARAQHRPLMVSPNPGEWSDDDIAWVLSRCGWDASGDLILGDIACEQWLAQKAGPATPLAEADTGTAYAALAEQAVAAGVAGSSAAGEFPKFPALRELAGSATPHVLVKFSGIGDSPTVQRWADLLVCEHLALAAAAQMPGVASAGSRILQQGGRTFLEVERFDRHGLFGRSPLNSLETVNAALVGETSSDWTRQAARLVALGLLSVQDETRVQLLWWFGRLIANSDMHLGNLSLVAQPAGFGLAPLYDMLPMAYAPLPGGEVPPRGFEPGLPLPGQQAVWDAACSAALAFWQAAAADARISDGFRQIARHNLAHLQQLAQRR